MMKMERTDSISAYRWEIVIFTLLILAVATASVLSPLYLNAFQILYSLQQSMVITGILAIGLMLVILVGEIDISIPAILAVGTVSFGRLAEKGIPFGIALIIVLSIATLAGLLNGFLIVTFSLPSMAVTLGMSGIYRALALWIGGNEGFDAATFSQPYIWIGSQYIGTIIPISLLLLVILFIAAYLIVHKSVYGRLLYATGNNRKATYLSGHSVKWVIICAFALAGFLAGLGALVYIGQYESARADNVSNILLFVVACVALGGFSLSGGKGNVIGLVLSILLLGTIQNGMGLANIRGPVQTLIIGLILVISIIVPVLFEKISGVRFHGKYFADKKSARLNKS